MTIEQLRILCHTLGIEPDKRPPRASTADKWPLQNYYATEPGCDGWEDIQALVADGLMMRGNNIPGGLIYFHVTDAGISAAIILVRMLVGQWKRPTTHF